MDNPYIIQGGMEGKKRLNVLSEVMDEHSLALIERDGPLTGQRFLDLGCGGGVLSIKVAKRVGEHGSVTAVDFDETLVGLARQDAIDEGIQNIKFMAQSAYDVDEEDIYDTAYSRFLLSHLTEPERVLQNMLRAVKRGGRVIVEDIDFSGHYCFPERWSFSAYVNWFTTAAENNGQNANIGLSLYQMLKDAGLKNVEFDVVQPAHTSGPGKWMAWLTMDRIKDTVIKQCLTSRDEVNKVLNDLDAFTKDTDSIISLPRVFRAWGVNGN